MGILLIPVEYWLQEVMLFKVEIEEGNVLYMLWVDVEVCKRYARS